MRAVLAACLPGALLGDKSLLGPFAVADPMSSKAQHLQSVMNCIAGTTMMLRASMKLQEEPPAVQ